MVIQSVDYFMYEVSAVPNQPGQFFVSPAPGHPCQWGESPEDVWKQSAADCMNFLDVSEQELAALTEQDSNRRSMAAGQAFDALERLAEELPEQLGR